MIRELRRAARCHRRPNFCSRRPSYGRVILVRVAGPYPRRGRAVEGLSGVDVASDGRGAKAFAPLPGRAEPGGGPGRARLRFARSLGEGRRGVGCLGRRGPGRAPAHSPARLRGRACHIAAWAGSGLVCLGPGGPLGGVQRLGRFQCQCTAGLGPEASRHVVRSG